MRNQLTTLALLAVAVALCACQGMNDISACERHYDGTVSGGTIQPTIIAGAAKIDCCPVNTVATTDHKNCTPVAPAVSPALTTGATVSGPAPKS